SRKVSLCESTDVCGVRAQRPGHKGPAGRLSAAEEPLHLEKVEEARGNRRESDSEAKLQKKASNSNPAPADRSTVSPNHPTTMSSCCTSWEGRRVSPAFHELRFDTALRKKAAANIFENVNRDGLVRLFRRSGDPRAEERVRSIFCHGHEPEERAQALMALKTRRKDHLLRIARFTRRSLKLH
ncbi:hypothetical protein GN956_G26803, partial [Arapaima gigas]